MRSASRFFWASVFPGQSLTIMCGIFSPFGSLAAFAKDLPGDRNGGTRRRPSGVKREMCDELDQLVPGYAVFECPLKMERKFVRAVKGDQRRHRDQAAVPF